MTVACLLVTVVGSLLAGAESGEIAWRGLIVVFALSFVSGVIIRTWNKWDELRGEAEVERQQQKAVK